MPDAENRSIIRTRPEFSKIQCRTSPWSRRIRSISADHGKGRQVTIFCIYEWALKSFYLYAEVMSAQQFGKTTGYEKWHRRLGHTLKKDIQDTIKHVISLERSSLDLIWETYKVFVLHDWKKYSRRFSRRKVQGQSSTETSQHWFIHSHLQFHQSKDISMLW